MNVDLTPAMEFRIYKLPVQLITDLCTEVQRKRRGILQKTGFYALPAGFDEWRISFSVTEKEILATSPDGFKACYEVLKVLRDDRYVYEFGIEEKEFRSQTIIDVLELILQAIKQEKLPKFFMPKDKNISNNIERE